MRYVWVGLAGAMGALTRYGLGLLAAVWLPPAFPWGTLAINLSGAFLLGLVAALGQERGVIPPAWRVPIATGFIGAYTTFSTWAVDTVRLLETGHPWMALANIFVSLALGLPATMTGLRLGRRHAKETGGPTS